MKNSKPMKSSLLNRLRLTASLTLGLLVATSISISSFSSATAAEVKKLPINAVLLPDSLHIPISNSTLPSQKVYFIYKNPKNSPVTLSVSGKMASLRLLHSGFNEKSQQLTVAGKASVRIESVSPSNFGEEKTVIFKIDKKSYDWTIFTQALNY